MQRHRLSRQGFTLVELSIVLVIIGLLIGGVLVGQSLVESAKINAQVKQFQQLDIATRNFISKFKGLPGDNTVIDTNSSTPAGCKGDGNGYLDSGSHVTCDDLYLHTMFHSVNELANFFWQIKYTGVANLNITTNHGVGVGLVYVKQNLVQSQIDDQVGFIAVGSQDLGGNFYRFVNNGSPTHQMEYSRLAPISAKALDAKMDDGNALTGTVFNATAGQNIYSTSKGDPRCNNTTTGVYRDEKAGYDLHCRLMVRIMREEGH